MSMTYITVLQPPRYRQMSLEEFLFQEAPVAATRYGNETTTHTYLVEDVPKRYSDRYPLASLSRVMREFNKKYEALFGANREDLYSTFFIAKRDKGMMKVFRTLFDQQGRYIPCNASDVCRIANEAFRPILKQHPCKEHADMLRSAERELREKLSECGFDAEKIDATAALKSGFRRIDAPNDALMRALKDLKKILEEDFGALYHTSAFAYIRRRSTLDSVKRHQQNESKWFAKYDLTDFFGSTTQEFVNRQLSRIFPFSLFYQDEDARRTIERALSLAFLNGGLPQGTPLSPTLTNIIMIPVDFLLFNKLRKRGYIYTRYADDFLISSKYGFDPAKICRVINYGLREFGAPFAINESKTRYGSSAGSNWNLGVMLNKDNEITIGYKNKRRFHAQLTSYILDRKNGHPWDKYDVQILDGYRNYYRIVEPEAIDAIVKKIGDKFGADIISAIKEDLRR